MATYAKILIGLCGFAGWSESSLGAGCCTCVLRLNRGMKNNLRRCYTVLVNKKARILCRFGLICFTANILGSFGRGHLTWPHCSWASLLGSLPVLSAHSWQLLFLNQRKRENGRRNVLMTKSPRKNVPDVGIEFGAACMPSEHASDRATAPGKNIM